MRRHRQAIRRGQRGDAPQLRQPAAPCRVRLHQLYCLVLDQLLKSEARIFVLTARNQRPAYLAAQVLGALLGVAIAHGMFGEPVFAASQHVRSGPAQLLSEFVATFGLLSVIWGVSRKSAQFTPFAVGAYITAAYWFT